MASAKGGRPHGEGEREYADATEALRQATEQHRRLLAEVGDLQRRYRAGGGGGVQAKLQAEVNRLTATLEEGQRMAAANTTRVRRHVTALKGELTGLHDEVDRMVDSVARAEESCRIATDEVTTLRSQLKAARTERDEAAAAMQRLMSQGREDVGTVRREIERMDAELRRLREQNDFMLLQQLRVADASR